MSESYVQSYDYSGEGVVLFIDKSLAWTSFDVVKKVRALFDVRKVGHAGTLDPQATGLMIVCTGNKTKSIEQFVRLEKEYTGSCEMGVRTPSFDMETAVSELKDSSSVTEQQIEDVAKSFFGKQLQMPPMYSAVKYGGKPLYQYARSGKTVERTEREIDVMKFEILKVHAPYVDFCIVCSKGTYIRSLVDEMGIRLGCGAALTVLRRTRIGEYTVAKAKTIEQLIEWRNTHFKQEQREHEACSIH
jgi:tRNA pseudouridine 55 synthase